MAARKKPVRKKKHTEKRALLAPEDCVGDVDAGETGARIAKEGGVVIGAYRDPFAGRTLVMAMLPAEKVEPTPFQRDVSAPHEKRLMDVIDKTGRYLDPIVCVTAPGGGFWTPNGNHRLQAMRKLGAKAITALVVPEHEVAWQILALNTEKAHNLRERAMEVIRIYRNLMEEAPAARGVAAARAPEESFAFYLEDPALVTLGLCYEKDGRFPGGAYHPVLRRLEVFSAEPLRDALAAREKTAALVQEVEAKVSAVVAGLRERGLTSPYLRPFVVARINPLRWIKGDLPGVTQVLTTMRDRAARFNVDKVRQEDLARSGGGAPPEES